MPYFFSSEQTILAAVYNLKKTGLTVDEIVFNWSVILQLLIYMVLALRLIYRYSFQVKDVFSSLDRIRITWVRNITLIALIVVLFFLTENAFMLAGVNVSNFFNLSAFVAAVAVYAMGYWGLLRAEIFNEPAVAKSLYQMQLIAHEQKHEHSDTGKYQKSGLTQEKAAEFEKQLMDLMSAETPYRDSNLTLNSLATLLGITPHNLSEVINSRLNQNFFDFVNSFRVEEVKANLDHPDKQNLTLLAIGLEAGFNSKSSFNAIFKKHTGVTPSEYRAGK
jgi:AraC-like DNA-binding protein